MLGGMPEIEAEGGGVDWGERETAAQELENGSLFFFFFDYSSRLSTLMSLDR
jgi:hypothetical protein